MDGYGTRRAHWIKLNHQNRIPGRWIAFDTESKREKSNGTETQTWSMGCAKRWRTGLKSGDQLETLFPENPQELWEWVTEFCRKEQRTVIWCHNLGYDVRISGALDILPALGWRLDWCNLASSVSSMTWRSDRGTLVFADMFAWLPMPLSDIGRLVGVEKLRMPEPDADDSEWRSYCETDVEILYRAVGQLVEFIGREDLGNWQPTGAGMSYAVWRHKFMTHKVLVHDDAEALRAERAAMHTGRAEAWRHGELTGETWHEVDIRSAYTRIAATTLLPTKLKSAGGALSLRHYSSIRGRFAVLAFCELHTELPSVPTHHAGREIWPVGHYRSWLWDTEIDSAIRSGAQVRILKYYTYTRAPILQNWAQWVLWTQERRDEYASPVVKKWVKHSGRTLIGRLALRVPQWEEWGSNPERHVGISHMLDCETGKTHRMMHAGDQTFLETGRVEGNDSLPQITGYIMAECRSRLWVAMQQAGFDNIAHVDTDGMVVNDAGLRRLRAAYAGTFDDTWQIKASYERMTVYGPRNYRGDGIRKVAGVPRSAVETSRNVFFGEQWNSLATDLKDGRTASVTIHDREWRLNAGDPRRLDSAGGRGRTVPRRLGQNTNSSDAASPVGGSGL